MEPVVGEILFYIVASIGVFIGAALWWGRQYPKGRVEWIAEMEESRWERK